MKKWLMLALALFVLTACNNTEDNKTEDSNSEDPTASTQETETETETEVGFEAVGSEIEQAANVPKEEQVAILAAFDEYIAAFNAKDIDRYVQTLSKNPKGFEYEEDVNAAKQAFAQYDIERTATDTTIVKYSEEEAQVFANLDIQMTEIETNAALASSGRQVTVFAKEDDAWKVTSVYYIGNDAAQ
ncbi:nuclear transport factor 2 family protein [Ureibacillus aquaedulcis]|uniref:Nuclear transport factor 2 family protein n=1 Tax=Ureibacillus aquaedulcis TaxID=3058421 RepID=A0ABT8GLA7_9BACL|nr:nuclear transport factor 2 family protein [Ureibacillus sp. BA0131]MDN4492188.1 nuclear transport factor 2 family protein [Ureibacillus sp. BA0131]